MLWMFQASAQSRLVRVKPAASGAGTTNDGTRYENDYVWLLTMRNGKAVKGTAFFDSVAFNELWRVKPADLHQN
ncbi:hypothetical protein [Pseudomonas sp. ADAK22]|uniref:hypothetical protein n=1 Tax=Pseudomonas sp. ADAK22 TaxID=2730851 RepID=UPI0014649F8E|nr:hypothetical protein [Pseudomonas sp. ADAK22]QJI10977.1 hypothetical protein HKK58_04520 [Pseudomonas sp. ADAK22]